MFKGKEGIALILAIFFVLVVSMLLMAILLLTNQEINATQLQLDSNKAFYFAEAGVEYGLAQVINEKSIEEINNSGETLFAIFSDSNIKTLNLEAKKGESPSSSDYIFTCEVRYNKARRKVRKEVELYTGVWSKAMGSNGDTNFGEIHSGAKIEINGDIYANGYIECNSTSNITINGMAYYAGDPQKAPKDLLPGAISSPPLSFPSTNFNYYYSIANYIYSSEGDFVNALQSSNPPKSGVVYITGDLHIKNLENLSITGLTIVVEGDIHINNQEDMTIDGGSNMVALIGENMKFNNDAVINFKNCIIYATTNIDFTNIGKNGSVKIDNGAMYAQNGYISLNNIKKTFTVNRGTWEYTDIPFLFDIYKTVLWTDTGI